MFYTLGNLVNSASYISHSSSEIICLARVCILLVAKNYDSQINDCSELSYINFMHL